MPGMPSTLSHCVIVPAVRSILTSAPRASGPASKRAYSWTPRAPETCSPTLNFSLFDATTTPMPPARMTSSMPTGAM